MVWITMIFTFCGILLFGGLVTKARAARGFSGDLDVLRLPPAAKTLTALDIPVPETQADQDYLGVAHEGKFGINDIKADVIIIEVFNFYCTHCQRVAPKVDEVFKEIQKRDDLRGRIKIIGIGITNSLYEVTLFKQKYHVPFPLFPDKERTLSDALNVQGTPTFFAAKKNDKGTFKQFFCYPGTFDNASQFLADIVKLSGMK
jgi:thiol-disulfide isomerase/thioredoxin